MIKNPYSFAPGFKTKSNMKLPLSSDGFYSDSIGKTNLPDKVWQILNTIHLQDLR